MKAYELSSDGYIFVVELQQRVLEYFEKRDNELKMNGNNLKDRMENIHAWSNVREILFSDMEV